MKFNKMYLWYCHFNNKGCNTRNCNFVAKKIKQLAHLAVGAKPRSNQQAIILRLLKNK